MIRQRVSCGEQCGQLGQIIGVVFDADATTDPAVVGNQGKSLAQWRSELNRPGGVIGRAAVNKDDLGANTDPDDVQRRVHGLYH